MISYGRMTLPTIDTLEMGKISLAEHLMPRENLVFRVTSQGAIVVDLFSGKCFTLNRSAAEIWKQAEAGKTISETVEVLRMRYGIPAHVAEKDTIKACSEMMTANLLISRAR